MMTVYSAVQHLEDGGQSGRGNDPPQKNPHCPRLEYASYCRCIDVVLVGNGSLRVDDADRMYTGGPKEREWLC